jgi:hypothetical protein
MIGPNIKGYYQNQNINSFKNHNEESLFNYTT